MCIKGAKTLSQICLKVFWNWRCFQRWISKVLRLFHEFALKCLEIEGVSEDVYQRCQHFLMNLLKSVRKLEVFQNMCIKSANTLPRICFRVFGNWRCFQRCVSKVLRLFHEFVLKCFEIGCVSKRVYQWWQDSSTKLLTACGSWRCFQREVWKVAWCAYFDFLGHSWHARLFHEISNT